MTQLGTHHELEDLGGGCFRTTLSIKPFAFMRNGVMRRATNLLTASGDQNFPLGVDEIAQFRLDTRIAGKSPLWYFGKGQSRVTLALLGANNISGTVNGNAVTFINAWHNADLTLTMAGHRLQKDILLRKGHPSRFQFRIDEHVGFDPQTLVFGNDFRILQPVLHNTAGMDDIPLVWDVAQSGGKWILTVTLPEGDWAGWVLDPTLTLQPDATDGLDTYTELSTPDSNRGTHNVLRIAEAGNNEATVIKFNLSSIPTATIVSATLELMSIEGFSGGAKNATAYRILPGNDWVELQATYNVRKTGTAWLGGANGCRIAGTDHDATAATDTVAVPATTTAFTLTFSADGVDDLQTMLTTNEGLVIKMIGWGWAQFASSDHATASWRPRLVIDYTLPGGGTIFSSSIFHSAVFGKTVIR